jgi:hypothetical protein
MTGLEIVDSMKIPGVQSYVEFKIAPRQLTKIATILYTEGIDQRRGDGGYGWSWDSRLSTVLIIQPWAYATRIDKALDRIRKTFYPEFHSALDLSVGVV